MVKETAEGVIMGLEKVIAVMKELGEKPKVENFEDKLIIQKTVCILGMLGFDMGYRFSMYVRGPYSPDLTKHIYRNQRIVENLKTDYSLTKREKELIEKVKEASDNLDFVLLEIMTTYAFLRKSGLEAREAKERLKRLKSFYSEAKIAVGISRAKELFPPSKEEIQEIRKEFAEWESAAISDFKY